jgi:DNA invertase Pin-like site-specific DNA recombinase
MKYGYVRASTADQDYSYQVTALEQAGCDRIFKDKASGKKMSRPDFDLMLSYLREGDLVAVWKIDRLGRTFNEAIATMAELEKRGIHLVSTSQGIDTSTPIGRMGARILLIIAEMELEFIRERTTRSREEKRKRGIKGGRPKHPFFSDPRKFATFKVAYDRKDHSVPELLRSFGLQPKDKYTFYRYLKEGAGSPTR